MESSKDGKRKSRSSRIKIYVSHNRKKNRKYVYCEIDGKRIYCGPLEQWLEIAKKLLAKAGRKEVADEIITKEKLIEDMKKGLEALDRIIQRYNEDAREIVHKYDEDIRNEKLSNTNIIDDIENIISLLFLYVIACMFVSKNWDAKKWRTPGEALAEVIYGDKRIDAFKAFYVTIRHLLINASMKIINNELKKATGRDEHNTHVN